MKLPPVIGIMGAAGSGKDTVADYILSLDLDAYKYSFAGPLKKGLCEMFGWSLTEIEDREFKEKPLEFIGRSPRYLMQTIGTEWGRELVHPDLWLLLADEWRKKVQGHMIISDVRFVNEAEWVRKAGGLLIHVVRPGVTIAESSHASETSLPAEYADAVLVNDHEIEDLEALVLMALQRWSEEN